MFHNLLFQFSYSFSKLVFKLTMSTKGERVKNNISTMFIPFNVETRNLNHEQRERK